MNADYKELKYNASKYEDWKIYKKKRLKKKRNLEKVTHETINDIPNFYGFEIPEGK